MHRFKTWQLFAICVVVWGTTWHAITYQLNDFSAEAGVAVRFALAGAGVLALCRWRGVLLAFSAADHGALAQAVESGNDEAVDMVLRAEKHAGESEEPPSKTPRDSQA